MPESAHQPESSSGADRARRVRGASAVFFVLGVALLAAAIWAVASRHALVEQAWHAVRDAPPLVLLACLVLPVFNWLSTSGSIWVLIGRYGRVRPGEMAALIGAAWLLNMLPMRPGMVGRLAYHKKFNAIRVRDSVRSLLESLACSGCSLVLLLIATALARFTGADWAAGASLAGPLVPLTVASALLRGRGNAWRWPAAIAFRYVDMLVWALRYTLVFALIGRPVGLVAGGALTVVGQLAMLTPVQLGLREWAIGMASTFLPESGGQGSMGLVDAAAPGLLADCVMRAAELVIVLPVGLTATAWVVRRMRRAKAEEPPAAGTNGAP